MIGILSKIFGGNKSDKDVKRIQPIISEINKIYSGLNDLSWDELRNKTQEFRQRIKQYLSDTDEQIAAKKAEAENNSIDDPHAREAIYNEVDKLVKKRDEQIEEILLQIFPEIIVLSAPP